MGIGLLLGAGAGALLGAATYRRPDCSQSFICLDFGPGVAAAAGAVVLGVPGMVVGAFAGSSKRERWRPLGTLAPRAALLPTGSRSAALAVSISF